jgi:hypothetical protein
MDHDRVLFAKSSSRVCFTDDLAVKVGQPALDAVMVMTQPLRIEARQVQQRRMEVVKSSHFAHRSVLHGTSARRRSISFPLSTR